VKRHLIEVTFVFCRFEAVVDMLLQQGEALLANILFRSNLFRHYFENRRPGNECLVKFGVEYAKLSVSPAFLTHRYSGLSFFSESTLAWPLSRPSDTGSWASTSPEFEVVALFEEFRDHLLRYLLSLGLSAHDGEEIIQESFLLLFRHLQSGKPRQNLRGWIFRVARNLALKQRAANHKRLQQVVEFSETLPEQHVDRNLNPEEELCDRRRQRRLLAVVHALPEPDRSCLHLRAEGLRYREIAQTLGISLGSVAASLAKSLAKLSRVDGGLL
jgi:RNA polymerase sigma-70 factor, ECF subfamily